MAREANNLSTDEKPIGFFLTGAGAMSSLMSMANASSSDSHAPSGSVTPAVAVLYGDVYRFVARLAWAARGGEALPLDGMDTLAGRLVATLDGEEGEGLFWYAHGRIGGGEDRLIHWVNVTILSARLGIALGWDEAELLLLARAGLCYDVGIARVPVAVLASTGPLSPQERALVQAHAAEGAALLKAALPGAEDVARIIEQHHEREHGRGYPGGLRGATIYPAAKVLGLLDVYEALMRPRPDRPAQSACEALRTLLRTREGAFEPRLLRALVNELSCFPPGTHVELTSGDAGVVIGVTSGAPLRPQVQVLANRWGKALRLPRVVDLAQERLLTITRVLEEAQLWRHQSLRSL